MDITSRGRPVRVAHVSVLALVPACLALLLTSVTVPVDAVGAAPATRTRTVTARGEEPRPGRFLLVGSVRPDYHDERVVILRQRGRTGRWQVTAVVRTDARGTYSTAVRGPERGTWCWTARVPATPGYRASTAPTRACVTVV